jgi:hypothetical protein
MSLDNTVTHVSGPYQHATYQLVRADGKELRSFPPLNLWPFDPDQEKALLERVTMARRRV